MANAAGTGTPADYTEAHAAVTTRRVLIAASGPPAWVAAWP